MALKFIGENDVPSYIALSTDISNATISGLALVGKLLFTYDDSKWYIVEPDLTLSDYAIPATFAGTIALGTVDIDQTTPGTTNGVVIGASAALADGQGNYATILTAPGAVSSSPLAVFPMIFSGEAWDRERTPKIFKDLAAVAITTIATIWNPASGKKFRLMGGTISVSAGCSVLFEDNVNPATIFRTPQLVANTPYSFELGNGILSAVANNVLKATASTGTVTITGTLYGTEE